MLSFCLFFFVVSEVSIFKKYYRSLIFLLLFEFYNRFLFDHLFLTTFIVSNIWSCCLKSVATRMTIFLAGTGVLGSSINSHVSLSEASHRGLCLLVLWTAKTFGVPHPDLFKMLILTVLLDLINLKVSLLTSDYQCQ